MTTKYPSKAIFKNISIRYKLLLFFLLISLLPITIIGFLSYSQAKQMIINKISQYSLDMVMYNQINLGKDLKTYEDIVLQFVVKPDLNQLLKAYSDNSRDEEIIRQNFKTALKEYVAGNQTIHNVIFIDESNRNPKFLTTGKSLPANFSKTIRNSAFYTNIIKMNGKNLWSPAILLEKESNNYYVAIGRRIKDISTGNPLGVLLAIVDENALDNAINSNLYSLNANNYTLDSIKTNYAIIVDHEGSIISSRFKDIIGKNIMDLIQDKQPIELMFNSISDKGKFNNIIMNKPVVITYHAVGSRGWFLLNIAPVSTLYNEINTLGFIIFILALVIALIATIIAFWISVSISVPLQGIVNIMKQAEDGLLSKRVTITNNDEIGFLGMSFNHMLAKISTLITNTKQTIKVVLEQSLTLKSGAAQSAETAEAVAAAMEQISQGTMEQTNETEKTTIQMNNLAEEINSVVLKASEVEKITDLTKDLSYKSKDSINLLIQKAKETDEITKTITENINELNASMDKIKGVTEVIAGITEQTNLLALNAAIEAARAGEAGLGFAVVSTEINTLANQSRNAAKAINEIIKTIQNQTLLSTNTSAQAYQIVEEQMKAVFSTRDSFDEIIIAMDNIIEKILEITKKIKKIDDFKEQTINSIMTISSISEETAASSQEISASSEEQTAIADQVKYLAEELHNLAENLFTVINTFVIEE